MAECTKHLLWVQDNAGSNPAMLKHTTLTPTPRFITPTSRLHYATCNSMKANLGYLTELSQALLQSKPELPL